MRLTLVFPPSVSGTYTPLGIATLYTIARRFSGVHVDAVDLNLSTIEHCAASITGGKLALDFFRGRAGAFHDRSVYSKYLSDLHLIENRIAGYEKELANFLNDGLGHSSETQRLLQLLVEQVTATDPDVICFSLFGPGQLVWALALAAAVKKGGSANLNTPSSAPIIYLGGAACSIVYNEEVLIGCDFIDGIVVGEGEAAIAAICNNENAARIPGLIYRHGNGIARNKNSCIEDSRLFPRPDFSGLDLHKTLNPRPVLPMVAGRGCAWRKCRFCSHNFSYGRYRAGEYSDIGDTIEAYAAEYGADNIYFADQYLSAEALEKLSDTIIGRGLRINFHVMGRPSRDYTKRLLMKAATAGCRWISWGVESGSQRLLDLCGKGTHVPTIGRVLKYSAAAGISNLAMMIFDLPTSSDLDFELTIGFLDQHFDYLDAMTASSFSLFEDTAFARTPQKYGLSISGRRVAVSNAGSPIHLKRLEFNNIAPTGLAAESAVESEAERWNRLRKIFGEEKFFEKLPCEHYLLFAADRYRHSDKLLSPDNRPKPRAA